MAAPVSTWGTAVWGRSVWGRAVPGFLCVATDLVASCAIGAAQLNCLEVTVMPLSVLQANVLRLTLKFRNRAGHLADPTLVSLRLLRPDATEVSPAPTPTRLSTGVWVYDLDTDGLAAGVWKYRGEGHGLVDSAAEGNFTITPSAFS